MHIRVAIFGFLATVLIGCSYSGPGPAGSVLPPLVNGPNPDVSQGGAVNGWVTLTLQNSLGSTYDTAVGHDGAFWSTISSPQGAILRTDTFGRQTVFPLQGFIPFIITPNPDGNMYFDASDANQNFFIGQITPQGSVTYFEMPAGSNPESMVTASDGNIWTIDYNYNPNQIDFIKMTTSGVFTIVKQFFPPTPAYNAGLVRGPDKNLWTVSGSSFARISVSDGSVTFFPTPQYLPCVTEGTDGGVWASSFYTTGLYRSDMSGNITSYPVHTGCPEAGSNKLLFWSHDYKFFGFDEIAGKVVEKITPPPNSLGSHSRNPGFSIGPDSQLWMPDELDNPNNVYVFILHQVIATPSKINVGVGSNASMSVTEKQSRQNNFSALSNDPNVATVLGSGENFMVTGVAQGSTTITVSDKIGNSLDVPVTVQ